MDPWVVTMTTICFLASALTMMRTRARTMLTKPGTNVVAVFQEQTVVEGEVTTAMAVVAKHLPREVAMVDLVARMGRVLQ